MLLVEKSEIRVDYPIGIRARYVFDDMYIGDSMHFGDYRQAESARISAIQHVKRHSLDRRYSLRKMTDGWRLFRMQ